ncbi:glycerophosphodiester phosphodiesterase family protein [Caballeronia sp. BR00000012568055]|uniref:glycerophosphodiester phosphodiesterase family protein n=1 Tax=Caballeronia sp. BR00000012568055 TaxID=2918761 RepID=UPI0023FA360F|nr:glycerophosphodiester phosphodiesterase family protein [Caballeronia sp. BR00000012568055]
MHAARSFTLAILLLLSGCAPSLPLIIAHRAGTVDYPENTVLAIRNALANHADAIWLTVQLTRDGVPVLYRPNDLSANTNGKGTVASVDLAELQTLNAGYNFAASEGFLYRTQPLRIPTLEEALRAIPPSVPVMLDMKALPAEPQAAAVARVLDHENAWQRVLIYSTDAAYQRAFAPYKQARLFESRDKTRARLAELALANDCTDAPPAGTWAAFEYARKVELTETFTLGEARSPVTAKLWTPASVACFREHGAVHIVAIGVNDEADYRAAAQLGIDAVLADSPRRMSAIRANLKH